LGHLLFLQTAAFVRLYQVAHRQDNLRLIDIITLDKVQKKPLSDDEFMGRNQRGL
jgi:hypothetical protein